MSLNINYQGNVLDGDENQVDCKYQAFSVNIGKWSDIRETESGQYNVNYGDGDLNTQAGSVSNGDVIIIVFWTGGATKEDEETLFAATRFVYNGDDNVVQDVQILPPHPPGCRFSAPASAIIGETVSVSSLASTTYQWEFRSQTLFQRRQWYGQTIFEFLDIFSDTFDFGNGDTDGRDTEYSAVGTYQITHTVTNTYSLSADCDKEIKIKYHAPVGGILLSNQNPLTNQSFDVLATIVDVDSRITSIDHIFDGETVASNTELSYQYSTSKPSLGTYPIKQVIYWNDGFDDLILEYNSSVTLQNRPPSIALTVGRDQDSLDTILADVVVADADGEVVSVCWELFYLSNIDGLPDPFFRCSEPEPQMYKRIYRECDVNKLHQTLIFAVPGSYRIITVAVDNYGATASDSNDFVVDTVCTNLLGDCPDTQPGGGGDDHDCSEEIELAIMRCVSDHSPSQERDVGCPIMVVPSEKQSASAQGGVSADLSGRVIESDMVGVVATKLKGTVSGGMSGEVTSGSISGRVKK